MIKKIREALTGQLVRAFLKSLFAVSIVALVLYGAHLLLSALFWSAKVVGFLLGALVGWGTYISYVHGAPKVGPFAETSGRW